MVHTTMALSWASRITSYSIFETRDTALNEALVHRAHCSPASAIRRSSCLLCAKPPPVPPSVYRPHNHGIPGVHWHISLLFYSMDYIAFRDRLPSSFISERKSSRSSALLIASRSVPSISTPNSSGTPSLEGNDQVQAGLPPNVPRDGIRPLLIYYALEEFRSQGSIYTLCLR